MLDFPQLKVLGHLCLLELVVKKRKDGLLVSQRLSYPPKMISPASAYLTDHETCMSSGWISLVLVAVEKHQVANLTY